MTFDDARATCQNIGGDLAIVDDCALLGDIADHISTSELEHSDYWVGATGIDEEGSFKWLDGSSVAMGAPFWAGVNPTSNEPNGEDNSCVAMDSEDGMYYHDYNCTQYYGVMCQRDEVIGACPSPYVSMAGGCFQFLNIGVVWPDARVVCQSSRGDLAVLDDCHAMSTIIEYLRNEGPWITYWIGGAKVGTTYEWIHGSAMKLGAPFWGRQKDGTGLQPDNYGAGEDCVDIEYHNQYYFNDIPCSDLYSPLCEAPLVGETLRKQPAE